MWLSRVEKQEGGRHLSRFAAVQMGEYVCVCVRVHMGLERNWVVLVSSCGARQWRTHLGGGVFIIVAGTLHLERARRRQHSFGSAGSCGIYGT